MCQGKEASDVWWKWWLKLNGVFLTWGGFGQVLSFPSSLQPLCLQFVDPICFLEAGFSFNLSGERERCLRHANELLLSSMLQSGL